jgi:AraC-like DNA-binding protein
MRAPRHKPYLFPEGSQFGVHNLVLHAEGRRHKVNNFAGPLSIKTVVRGTVSWTIGDSEFVVDPGSFLVLGEGERYSMDVDLPRPVETACIFFQKGFVEAVANDATTSINASLEDPERAAPPLPFISRLHADSEERIVAHVQTFARRCSAELQPSGFEEGFLLLSAKLLHFYGEIQSRLARVPALKASTREELLRRVETGREFIHAQAGGPLSLDAVAKASCLSRYHFHRVFTQVFGKTPHTYLTEVRLARARSALRAGIPVVEVCVEVGFSSPSSFSRLFRKRYGVSPAAVRDA